MLKLTVPKNSYLRVGDAILYFGKGVRVAVDAPKNIEVRRGQRGSRLRTCHGSMLEGKV